MLASLVCLLVLALALTFRHRISTVVTSLGADGRHRLVEVLVSEHTLLVDHQVDTIRSGREEVVLKRSWSEIGVDNVTGLVVGFGDPFGKLHGVWNGSRQEDIPDLVGQQDNSLFPDDTSRLVAHVVDLIEHDPCNFAHNLRTAVKHRTQNLGGHNQTGGGRVDCDISSHQSNVAKFGLELTVLLVTQRLDGTGVDDSLVVLQTLCNRIFSNNSFTRTGVRGDQYTLITLDRHDRHLLEGVESEGPCARGFLRAFMLRDGHVIVVRRQGDLMADLMFKHDCGVVLLSLKAC